MLEPPVPFGNAAARWYYVLLRGLVRRGHQVTAFASCTKESEISEARQLFSSPEYDLRLYPARNESSIGERIASFIRPMSYLFTPALRRDFSQALQAGYDVLHLEHLWSAWLAPRTPAKTVVNVHYLVDIDARCEEPVTLKDRLLLQRRIRAERALLMQMKNICALSPRLTDRISQINPHARTFTVPLGIDLSLYPFDRNPSAHDRPTVGLIGSFNWGPSLRAGQHLLNVLWPQINERVPGARLMLVGRTARRAFGYAAGEDVIIESDVPDTKAYFNALDVLLYAPPVGSGMKVKILEAFALGTPVVTNDEGIEGLPVRDGVHAGVANDDAGLVERAVTLLSNAAIRSRYRIAARDLVMSQCSEQATLNQVESMYEAFVPVKAPRGVVAR
jgi:glycosyltransferase involved in cell wall biosynthesis